MKKLNYGFRLFSYFRTGYGTYFAMFVGMINIMTSTYFLAVDKIPFLLVLFPTFELYIATIILVGLPIVILVGWIHLKRVGLFSAEQNIITEVNPYNYKPPPGFAEKVIYPAYHELTKLLIKQINDEKLTEDEEKRLDTLEKNLLNLMKGGYAGDPPKGAF